MCGRNGHDSSSETRPLSQVYLGSSHDAHWLVQALGPVPLHFLLYWSRHLVGPLRTVPASSSPNLSLHRPSALRSFERSDQSYKNLCVSAVMEMKKTWWSQQCVSCFYLISCRPPTCCSSYLDDVIVPPVHLGSVQPRFSSPRFQENDSSSSSSGPLVATDAHHADPERVIPNPCSPSETDRLSPPSHWIGPVSVRGPHAEHRPPSLALCLLNRRHIGCYNRQRPR